MKINFHNKLGVSNEKFVLALTRFNALLSRRMLMLETTKKQRQKSLMNLQKLHPKSITQSADKLLIAKSQEKYLLEQFATE